MTLKWKRANKTETTNERNRAIWLVYRTDTNARGRHNATWLANRTMPSPCEGFFWRENEESIFWSFHPLANNINNEHLTFWTVIFWGAVSCVSILIDFLAQFLWGTTVSCRLQLWWLGCVLLWEFRDLYKNYSDVILFVLWRSGRHKLGYSKYRGWGRICFCVQRRRTRKRFNR